MAKKKVSKGNTFADRHGIKARKSHKAHQNDPTVFSAGGDPPPGVVGIAKLTTATISQYKSGDREGEDYFRAAGVIVEPKEVASGPHKGTPVEGLATSIMVGICDDNYNDFDTNYQTFLNELRKLGVDTSELDISDLEDVLEQLVEEAPYFRFRTYESQQGNLKQIWNGVIEKYEGNESEDDVDEEEEEEEEEEESDSDEDEEEEDSEEEEDEDDESGDEEEEDDEEEEEEDEEEEEEVTFEKGEPVFYKPPGKKKRVECEITRVNTNRETLNVKDLDSGKIFKGVAFSKVSIE